MLVKLTGKSFYSVIRYRLFSHICTGKRKEYYQEKYCALKKILNTAGTEKCCFLGIPVLTIKYIHEFICWELFGFPICVKQLDIDRMQISPSEKSIYALLTALEDTEL